MNQIILFKFQVLLFSILGNCGPEEGAIDQNPSMMRLFLFLSPALVMSGSTHTHTYIYINTRTHTCARPHAHTDPICLFFWKLHNCQLLIQWSAGMMLIIIQQSWEMWGGVPQWKKEKKKIHYWNWKKKKYYISTVREVITLLSAAVF